MRRRSLSLLVLIAHRRPPGPLVFHFAGDNVRVIVDCVVRGVSGHTTFDERNRQGVGKTLATRLIAEARFARHNGDGSIDGYLYMRGEMYRESDPQRVREYRNDLARRVVSQLARCRDALIVLDEVEKVHHSTVAVLQDFTDATNTFVEWNETRVDTSHAIFIFVSDFGTADASAGLSDAELRAKVEETSRRVWRQRKQVRPSAAADCCDSLTVGARPERPRRHHRAVSPARRRRRARHRCRAPRRARHKARLRRRARDARALDRRVGRVASACVCARHR